MRQGNKEVNTVQTMDRERDTVNPKRDKTDGGNVCFAITKKVLQQKKRANRLEDN